ncbi:MAG: outer membrane beta-barrel protein [Bacteroidales bacterium]
MLSIRVCPGISVGVTEKYPNYTPNVNLNYEFKNHLRLEASYNNNITAPQFNDLQPIKNYSNRRTKRRESQPEARKLAYGKYRPVLLNPASFANIGGSVDYTIIQPPHCL